MIDQSARPGPADARARGLVAAALVVGLALRLAFAFGYWTGEPLTHDEREYLALAGSLASGQGFSYQPGDTDGIGPVRFSRAPLYPVMLAGIRLVSSEGDFIPAIRLAQCLIGALSIALLAFIAFRVADARAGIAAAAVGAVHLPLAWISGFVLSETLYCALALGGVLALLPEPADERRGASNPLAAGILAGLAALARPTHLFVIAIATAVLAASRHRRRAAIFAAGAALMVLPWTARNYVVHHRLVPIAPVGGINFWVGNHPFAVGDGDMAANPQIGRDNLRFRAEHPGLSEEALEPLYYREALRAIADDPVRWLGLLGRKAWYSIVPAGPSYTLHSARYRVAVTGWWVLLLPPAVLGYVRLVARGRPVWPLLALAAGSLAASLVFFPQERYRIPALDPVVVIGAAAWWALRPQGDGPRV